MQIIHASTPMDGGMTAEILATYQGVVIDDDGVEPRLASITIRKHGAPDVTIPRPRNGRYNVYIEVNNSGVQTLLAVQSISEDEIYFWESATETVDGNQVIGHHWQPSWQPPIRLDPVHESYDKAIVDSIQLVDIAGYPCGPFENFLSTYHANPQGSALQPVPWPGT